VKRREFIILVGGAAAWPLTARAQQPAMPVIGYLAAGVPETSAERVAAFRKGLGEAGYIEGRNVAIEFRWGRNDNDRLPELAADLVRRRVAVIATPGSLQTPRAAKAATATIPIVFSMGRDPVEAGLVASLNRPGGNVTGFTEMAAEIAPKRFGLVRELLPGAARFAMLLYSGSSSVPSIVAELQAAASAIGGQFEVVQTGATLREIDATFAALAQKRVDALLVDPSVPFYDFRGELAALAARHALPAIYWDRVFAEAGGLMSYGSSVEDLFRQVGVYTGRILKGEKPADMPVQQPTKFEFVINRKTARTLGLDIPSTLLVLADEVIE